MIRRHLFIPDPQIRPREAVKHILWASRAIVDYRPDVIVVAGDWWDMPSLNGHEKQGSKPMEGQRYSEDVAAGNEAFELLVKPMRRLRSYKPECHFLFGNHEHRIVRAASADPKLDGVISLTHLKTPGFKRHPFLERVWIDGIVYSHYFQQQNSHHAIGGTVDNRLNRIGDSFVQGHQQGFLYGNRVYPTGRIRHGLVAGSFYLHNEDYKGPQGNDHWRGIVMLNEVKDGDYGVMPLSMNYLRRKYG